MFKAKYIKPRQYAELMSLSMTTVYRHFKAGKICGYQDENTGTIYILNPEYESSQDREGVVLYARVSSSQNKDNLDRQLERLRLYAAAKGYRVVKEVKEIGSGLNDQRPKLENLLKDDSYERLIVEHKDRLTRFGFHYLEAFLNERGQEIEVINEVVNDKDDLMDDFVAIITSFTARLYGLKRSKRKTEAVIEALNDENHSD